MTSFNHYNIDSKRLNIYFEISYKLIIIKGCYIAQKEFFCRRTLMLRRAVLLENYVS